MSPLSRSVVLLLAASYYQCCILVVEANTSHNSNHGMRSSNHGGSRGSRSHRYFDTSQDEELWRDDDAKYGDDDDDDDDYSFDKKGGVKKTHVSPMRFKGLGREFDLFGTPPSPPRGGSSSSSGAANDGGGSTRYYAAPSSSNSSRRVRSSRSRTRSYRDNDVNLSSSWLSDVREWIAAGNLPKIQCRVEPNTTLKVRKTFRPLKTVIRLGADFNTQLGVWQFKSSWEDSLIGGKLTLAGRELQLSKTWLLSVGAVEDLVTRLRFRAAVDLGTMKAYARLGFRTERLSPINVVEGFTLMKQLPLDGTQGHVKLEVKANFAFPEPEIEYSTENNRSFVGMGDIEVNIDELNLLLDY